MKGLYAKARRGEIPNFTGISDPYEPPKNPEIVVYTDKETVEESINKIISYLERNGYLPSVQEYIDHALLEEEEKLLREHLRKLGFARKSW